MGSAKIRQLVSAYLDRVRAFNDQVMSIDSGIYPPAERAQFIHRPDSLLRMENEFVDQLLLLLRNLQQYVSLGERWRSHLYGVSGNLQFTQEEQEQVLARRLGALEVMREKDYIGVFRDGEWRGYLQWVAVNAAEELERLLAETRYLHSSGKQLLKLVDRFRGDFLLSFRGTLSRWLKVDLKKVTKTLQGWLNRAAYARKNLLLPLSRYIDSVVNFLCLFPLPTPEGNYPLPSDEEMERAKRLSSQLVEAGVKVKNFLDQRTRLYLLFIEHELAIIQAVLPKDLSAIKWFVTFATNLSKSAHELLPGKIQTDTLPMALKQATDSLVELDYRLETAEQMLNEAELLIQILRSPAVTKFLQADKERLSIYRSWRLEFLTRLRVLREVVQSDVSG